MATKSTQDKKLNTVAYLHFTGMHECVFTYCPKCHKKCKCRQGTCQRIETATVPLECSNCSTKLNLRSA